jgi:hypothetical protein
MLASILMENQGIFRASAAKRPKQPQNNKMGKGNRLALTRATRTRSA